MTGEICNIEIPVLNIERAKEFYSLLFGWEVKTFPMMKYANWKAGNMTGAFSQVGRIEDSKSKVIVYMMVDDIGKKLDEIQTAGGTIVRGKVGVPGYGWTAQFKDVFGNTLGLFCKEEQKPEKHLIEARVEKQGITGDDVDYFPEV
ncbi:MAG: VOC family protein [Candidatus Altiarchaeota archaeon]|nr:VOC family protein [Candidatus Altiarchaeota archaeon]